MLEASWDAPVSGNPTAVADPTRDPAFHAFQSDRRQHWDAIADTRAGRRRWAGYYHHRLEEVIRLRVRPGLRILEIGCAQGDLLAALQPAVGVGVDFSGRMLALAAARHPGMWLVQADGHCLPLQGTFDVILLSDLLNDVWDVQTILQEVARLSGPRTRVWITSYNRLWEPALALVGRLGLAHPNLHQNWLTLEDIQNLLYLTEFQPVHSWVEILWPLGTPLLAPVLNRFLVAFWPFRHLALTHVLVGRPAPSPRPRRAEPSVSIVVPARNEAGNITELLQRMPALAAEQEIIFVEGHSRDDTVAVIERAIAERPRWPCRLLRQHGEGKGDAVREGFAHARGDILMILDADLTVPPEDLPRFYSVLVSGQGELANGVRLVYPMEGEAMRFFNLVGNKAFTLAFSWLLGQPVKDTLCGTKALWREDYEVIAAQRAHFGQADPFGDFDLLLGGARQSLKIVDVPIRYRRRTYGTTNISRWRHGAALMTMVVRAARRLKFV
jgi:SAM-dependent methyltransferase